jgi:hypothetical protein
MVTQDEIYTRRESLQDELTELNKLDAQQKIDMNAWSYGNDGDSNLIQWQLSVNDILDTLYHLLRGDRIKIKNGERIWENAPEGKAPISEDGVQDILREVFSYINKNLLLSYYDIKQINLRLYTFGDFFIDLIMDNYEILGMDTEDKEERYSMICLATINAVNSAYNRALGGKERDSLTKKTMVHQNATPQSFGNMPQRSGGGLTKLNPLNWFKT